MLQFECLFLNSFTEFLTYLNFLVVIHEIVSKILYDDGDVEVLQLDRERWELLDNDPKDKV